MVNIYLDIHYDFFRPKLKVASSFSPFRKLAWKRHWNCIWDENSDEWNTTINDKTL